MTETQFETDQEQEKLSRMKFCLYLVISTLEGIVPDLKVVLFFPEGRGRS